MVLKQEEQINRYLEHGMSSAEEQNFLISLAASDDMRMAFRSHLELMKAVRNDKDDLRSVAQVRNRTLAALGLSATAASAFIEQELVRSNKEHAALQRADVVSGPGPLLTRIGRFVGMQKLAIGTGLALGFLAATGVFTSGLVGPSHDAVKSPAAAVSQPVSEPKAPAVSPTTSSVASRETVEHSNALHNSRGYVRHAAQHNAVQGAVSSSSTPSTLNKTSDIPEVNKAGAATISANKAKINKPNDSNQAH